MRKKSYIIALTTTASAVTKNWASLLHDVYFKILWMLGRKVHKTERSSNRTHACSVTEWRSRSSELPAITINLITNFQNCSALQLSFVRFMCFWFDYEIISLSETWYKICRRWSNVAIQIIIDSSNTYSNVIRKVTRMHVTTTNTLMILNRLLVGLIGADNIEQISGRLIGSDNM